METIKINGNSYELVAGGYQLHETGGRIIFQPGASDFATIKADLLAAGGIEVLDDSGNVFISRSDLVYAGRMQEDDNYIVGFEQVETGTDESGNPIYETRDVIGTVMIADFREPDLREQYADLEAKMDYLAMMTDVEMEA